VRVRKSEGQYAACLTGNAVFSSALDVERGQVFSESVRRTLGEQVARHLLGDEPVVARHTAADQTQHHHVYSIRRRLVYYVRSEKLLKQTLQPGSRRQQTSSPGAQRTVRIRSLSAEGNADGGRGKALKLRPSLRCLPLTDIPRPLASPYATCALFSENSTSSTKPEAQNLQHCRQEDRATATCNICTPCLKKRSTFGLL